MPRTGATFMQFIRSLQHPPPDPSVQATVHALMGGPEQPVAPIDVDVFAFGSEAPLEVATKRALFSPGLKAACDMHKKRRGPFALGTEPPVLATPAGGTRRSGGASLRRRRRFRVASGRGCCAQLAIAHARLFRGICARACRPWFRAGIGILGGTGTRTRPTGLTTSEAIKQALSAKKGVRPQDEQAVMPPHAETCLCTLVRKRARTPLSRLPVFLTRTLGAAPDDLERTRVPTEPSLRRE